MSDSTDRDARATAAGELGSLADARDYEDLYEHAPDMYYSVDPGTVEVKHCNQTLVDKTGFTKDEIIGHSVFDRYHPDCLPDVERALESFVATGRIENARLTLRHKDGHAIPVLLNATAVRDTEGNIVRSRSSWRDISDLVRAERMFQTLLEQAPDAMIVVGGDDTIVLANDQARRMFGYDDDGIVGRQVETLVPTWSREQRPAQGAGPPGAPSVRAVGTTDMHAVRKDGSEVPVEISVAAIDLGGSHLVSAAIRDVTDQLRAEKAVLATQRLEAVGRLAGGIAHDFNNLLTIITNFATFAAEDAAHDASTARDLGIVLDAAQRARVLTGQLLAFSRRQPQALSNLDVNEVVGSIEGILGRLIGEDVELERNLADDLGTIQADPAQLEQVLMNLVLNASQAMPDGGRVTVETRNLSLDEAFSIRKGTSVPPGEYVLLAVTDTGHGMDDDTRRQIFEPYFTTKPTGTGLGLSTVFGIVKQSGGYIWVYSEPGQGTTFKVYLPRVELPPQSIATDAVDTTTSPPGGTETVLVVEDESDLRAVVVRILERGGYRVLQAASPAAATALLAADHGVDLLVTDVVMPGASGRELADQLVARMPELRVLFMSGYPDDAIVRHGVLGRGVEYIPKPFTAPSLLRRVRGVLDAE